MKRVIVFILVLLFVTLSACKQNENRTNSYDEEHEGIIARITELDADDEEFKYRMLVISNVDINDVLGKTEDELIELAQENDGADYDISDDMYDQDRIELNQGVKVNVYWGGEDEGESNPPVRRAEKISVIPK
ncbi:hypothetical protein [Virgibacillus sp. SK37]|uniref:hypothetical protein n=1 Tax=Virgibacillus sp. SK37 TaxID=403957 RepID=UPI0004D1C956|nr:hypothetical protein [Virgibacillus sp. SK37]AIF45481.1 hypothetical protein X953_13070 [Virgibacillus sp. SK37]